MTELTWLIRKDLMRFFADRQGALMTVLLPVVLASLLGMLFAPRESNSQLALLVVDQDGGPRVRAFVQAMRESGSFDVTEVDAVRARTRVQAGEASLALLLPAGTNHALRPGGMFDDDRGQAELWYDPSDEIELNLAAGLLTQLLMEQTMGGLNDAETLRSTFTELEQQLDEHPEEGSPALRTFVSAGIGLADHEQRRQERGEAADAGLRPPLDLRKTAVAPHGAAAGYNSYAHNFAGMLLLFLLFMAQGAAKNLVEERDEGSLVRLRTAPVKPAAILLSTVLSTAIIALLASAVVYGVGIVVFGIRIQGALAGFAAVVGAQSLFVGSFALLLAGLGRTKQQIESVGSFAVLLICFAGGAMFPSFFMPDWLHTMSKVLPTYWATRGLAAMTWRGLALDAAWWPTTVLVAFALGCTLVGIRRFRWS